MTELEKIYLCKGGTSIVQINLPAFAYEEGTAAFAIYDESGTRIFIAELPTKELVNVGISYTVTRTMTLGACRYFYKILNKIDDVYSDMSLASPIEVLDVVAE